MSSFTGKFREYPLISADNFEKENLDSLAFFLSHCHKDHMSGLDSTAFHGRLIGSKTVFVYCSETTENLLMCNPEYVHLKEHIRSIPLEQQTMIPLFDENTAEESSICVTLLPAGHCVGSVMFLFEGQHGNILYTGDFRLSKGDVKRIPFFHANGRIKDIKSIYIDTTFCLPKTSSLPTREQSRDAIIELINRWFSRGPEYVVSLLCKGMYGFEYLLKEVAMNFKTKIHVSADRLRMYKYLPNMTPYFTADGRSTKIHACKWQSNRHSESDLPCGESIHPSRKMKVLRIKPATMWVARGTEAMPADYKRYDKGKRMWRVVHSMHASMEEVQDFVGYLKPYHAYPNVPPAGLDTLEDAFERLKGLTRLQECNSCNQDESDECHFNEKDSSHCTEEQKPQISTIDSLRSVARPAPDEKVLAQCKELGIEEEQCIAPVPKRRRGKTLNPVLDEITANALQQRTEASTSYCHGVYRTRKGEVESGVQIGERSLKRNCKTEARTEDLYKNRIEGGTSESCEGALKEYSWDNFFDEESVLSKTNDSSDDTKNNFPEQTTETKRPSPPWTVSESQSEEGVAGEWFRSKSNFNVPPSPGHIKPRPEKVSIIHRMIQHGQTIAVKNVSEDKG